MLGQINEKKARLEAEKKAAIRESLPPVRVITLTLRSKTLEDRINLPATVVPYENLWVKAEVPGQVVRVPVKEGQIIDTGQVLVELDDRDYRTRLERIEANYELALSDRDRISDLVKKKIAASTELDKMEARLKDLFAQLKEAKLALSRTKIIAPISGRLNELKTELGDRLGVDKPVAQILQFEKVKVTVGIPESDVNAVFDLNEADIIIEALDKRRVKGTKIFLSRQPRDLARLYDLELVVQNPDGRILPGMFARVQVVYDTHENALLVPKSAILSEDTETWAFVIANGTVNKKSVSVGYTNSTHVEVVSGLSLDDIIVTTGLNSLKDGSKIKVIEP